jgi:hypothetical protein
VLQSYPNRARRGKLIIIDFATACGSPTQPPQHDDGGERNRREPVEELSDDNDAVETNKNSRFEKNRQRQRAPNANREVEAPGKSSREDRHPEAHRQRKQASDADCGENVEQTRAKIIAGTFRSPRIRRFSLVAVKDDVHPKPACDDRDYARDKAGNERGT